tara:strand:- start:294 stop:512 length:219 start_codon:yes stop_codon:yes gene_type:complete
MKLSKTKLKQIIKEELKEAHIVRETKEDAKALKVILTNMVKAFADGGDRATARDEVLKFIKTELDIIVSDGN